MEKVIGYKTEIRDGKEVFIAIREDIGPALAKPSSWSYRARQQMAVERLLRKTEKMSDSRRRKYLNGVMKKHLGIPDFKKEAGLKIGTTATKRFMPEIKRKLPKPEIDIFIEPTKPRNKKYQMYEAWNRNRKYKITYEEYLEIYNN